MSSDSDLDLVRRGVEELIGLFTAQKSVFETLTRQLQNLDSRLTHLERHVSECNASANVLAEAANYARAELVESQKMVEKMFREWDEAGRPYRQREPSSPESPRSLRARDTDPAGPQ